MVVDRGLSIDAASGLGRCWQLVGFCFSRVGKVSCTISRTKKIIAAKPIQRIIHWIIPFTAKGQISSLL